METQTPKRGKTNGYNSTVLHMKRDHKRQDAEARQRDHDKLTVAQKIAKAQKRDGDSKKEIARLTALLPATPAQTKPAVKAKSKTAKA
jgi:hypothetical protein